MTWPLNLRHAGRAGVASALVAICVHAANPEELVANPTPQMYVEHNKGGARVVPSGQMSLDNQPVACGSFPTVLDPYLNDYAAAPYKGFLILNPELMPKVTTPVKLWIFYHECAHLLGIRNEGRADCFSAQRGRRDGWLSADGLEKVCAFISHARANRTHSAGPERCAAIRACYGRNDVHPPTPASASGRR